MRNFSKLFRFTAVAAVIISVFAGCLSYSVDSVEVSIEGNATSIDAGKTIQFNFLVNASGKDTSQAQRVTWSVSSTNDGTGPVTPGTSVSPSGTLAVSADEIYPVLYVRATHQSYKSKYDFKQIQVTGPKVGSVVLSVTGNATTVAAGGTLKLSAFVAGQAPNQGLTYSVGSASSGTGAVAAGTAIAADGTLTVSANETASSLYVRAVSNSDATKSDIKEIKIVTVTSVTVTAEGGTARALRGGTLKFSAAVAGNNSPGQNVTWKVSSNAAGDGAVTAGTAIAADGTLTVAATEAAATLYVIATSAVNTARSGSITVVIPTVTSVTVTPANPQIRRGEGTTFAARVQGTGNPSQDVTWKLDGIGGAPTTTITSNGMLIVSTAETLSQLLVTATSVDDPAKFGTTMIAIPATPAAIVPVTPAPQTTAPAAAAGTYIITGSGTAFSATRGGAAIGTAGQPIQTVIDAIRTNAAGAAVTIQFGDGTAVLDIGSAPVNFNNTGGNWGAITFSGKITGSQRISGSGIINIRDNISATSRADITSTDDGPAIYHVSTGTMTIAGGTVQSARAYAIYMSNDGGAFLGSGTLNITGGTVEGGLVQSVMARGGVRIGSNSTLNITGGTVRTENGSAVYSSGANSPVNISGGTVSATTGSALELNSNGKATISGTARVTSANTNAEQGTIYFGRTYTATAVRLEITGGTVENTSTTTGNVIRNASPAAINITGGTVSKAGSGGFAINNSSTGVVTIAPAARITGERKLTP